MMGKAWRVLKKHPIATPYIVVMITFVFILQVWHVTR